MEINDRHHGTLNTWAFYAVVAFGSHQLASAFSRPTFGYLSEWEMAHLALAGVSVVAAAICFCVLIHRLWTELRPADGRVSARAAVGRLFIPVFNLYWIFALFGSLAKASVKQRPVPQRFPDSLIWPLSVLAPLSIVFVGPIAQLLSIVLFSRDSRDEQSPWLTWLLSGVTVTITTSALYLISRASRDENTDRSGPESVGALRLPAILVAGAVAIAHMAAYVVSALVFSDRRGNISGDEFWQMQFLRIAVSFVAWSSLLVLTYAVGSSVLTTLSLVLVISAASAAMLPPLPFEVGTGTSTQAGLPFASMLWYFASEIFFGLPVAVSIYCTFGQRRGTRGIGRWIGLWCGATAIAFVLVEVFRMSASASGSVLKFVSSLIYALTSGLVIFGLLMKGGGSQSESVSSSQSSSTH